jgi:integrase
LIATTVPDPLDPIGRTLGITKGTLKGASTSVATSVHAVQDGAFDVTTLDVFTTGAGQFLTAHGAITLTPRASSATDYDVLAALSPRERPVVEFAAASGLRRGEVFALRWRDVDFEAREIHARRSKTEAGERTVPMFGSCRRLLLEQKAGSRYKRPEDYVFGTAVGTQEHACRWYEREFRDRLDKAGLSHRFHDLRHYAVSKLIEQGASVLLVAKIAGHSRPSVTLDVYSHLFDSELAEAAARYDPLRREPRLRAVDER